MARRIGEQPGTSPYPLTRRWADLFAASLQNPASPTLVGQKILDIIASGTWQLRHPVGPDSVPLLRWRASKTDEQWIDWGSSDDETWYQMLERDLGLNARPKQ